jgi:peroxiredoxin Q/BCP
MGISKDSLSSHKKFRDKQDLNFLLLSDEEGRVHEQFKVIVPKKMYGKEYMGTERSTFVFDRNGEMVKEYRKVKSAGHAEEVLGYIRENMK